MRIGLGKELHTPGVIELLELVKNLRGMNFELLHSNSGD